jgi:hypothetical protein
LGDRPDFEREVHTRVLVYPDADAVSEDLLESLSFGFQTIVTHRKNGKQVIAQRAGGRRTRFRG